MILLRAKVSNFGSYSDLEFDFNNQGLSLVYGSTGSGKSTLQDVPLWVLYGTTAKDGSVDEIRPWYNKDEPTEGSLSVITADKKCVSIHRVRGSASQNDLYWQEENSDTQIRGKNLLETQSMLEARLGITRELYLSAATYNEFSPTSTFFTAKAKDRRELFEKLAILDLPLKVSEKAANKRKSVKKELDELTRKYDNLAGQVTQVKLHIANAEAASEAWEITQEKRLNDLKVANSNFLVEKETRLRTLEDKCHAFDTDINTKILKFEQGLNEIKQALEFCSEETCSHCGETNSKRAKLEAERVHISRKLESTKDLINPFYAQLEAASILQNPHLLRLEYEVNTSNPFIDQVHRLKENYAKLLSNENVIQAQCSVLSNEIVFLTQLYDLSFELRGHLLSSAVKKIQNETNGYLSAYFDSELNVKFNFQDSDDLEVSITKNGYPCVYRQLSKGQRSLLKLTFSLAVMKAAANRAGVHFDTVCFDEALDGLDVDLKLKAFRLFEELSKDHSTILVIDHSEELKALFNRHYKVTMEADMSTLYDETR